MDADKAENLSLSAFICVYLRFLLMKLIPPPVSCGQENHMQFDGPVTNPRSIQANGQCPSPEVVASIGSMTRLVGLELDGCPVRDIDVATWSNLKRLINVSLCNTMLTDAACEFLAACPKISLLWLDGVSVTGEGLRYFAGHKGLRTLSLCYTPLSDAAVPNLLAIPKLSMLLAKGTSLSMEGIMRLAVHPKLTLVLDDPGQVQAFETEQRRFAHSAKSLKPITAEDRAAAEAAFEAFRDAMEQWEIWLAVSRKTTPKSPADASDRCREIFAKYCTNKPRKRGRPNAVSYSEPPTYEKRPIEGAESAGTGKIKLYVIGEFDQPTRYLIVRTKEGWRVDSCESKLDGWTPDYL